MRRLLLGGALVACASCAPPPAPSAPIAPIAPARCGPIDARDLLARHARGYGTREAVRASLPRSSTATIELGGQKGEGEMIVAVGRSRGLSRVGGIRSGNGVDATGPWVLDGSGVPLRITGVEATSLVLDEWMTTRGYLDATLTTTCEELGGRALVHATPSPPVPGAPELVFDLTTAELASVAHGGADGTRTITRIDSWTPPDTRGVRWPLATRDRDELGNETIVIETSAKSGLVCAGATGEACLAMPGPEIAIGWGPSGVTRVPFEFDESEILIRMSVEGRAVWGLLDSGASTSAIDATRPVVAGFRPGLTIEGSGVDQTMKIGLGTLARVSVGALVIERLPVASVPLPTLDAFEARRPELIFGFTVFAAGAVRVDYAKSEVAFAAKADGLVAKDARAVPLRVLDGKPVVDAIVEGRPAVLELDTGNSGGVQLTTAWARTHALPGERPVARLRGIMGAGTQETEAAIFRVSEVEFGGVKTGSSLVGLMATPAPGTIAGLLGNELLSRCPAVVFDVPGRTLWLEGPCTRETGPSRSGLRLAKHESAGFAKTPWVVTGLVPTGSAERADIQEGDRLLAIDDQPVTTREQVDKACRAPKGTIVRVVVQRGRERLTIAMKLVDALAM